MCCHPTIPLSKCRNWPSGLSLQPAGSGTERPDHPRRGQATPVSQPNEPDQAACSNLPSRTTVAGREARCLIWDHHHQVEVAILPQSAPPRDRSPLCSNPISFPLNLLAGSFPVVAAPSCYSLSGETTPHPRRSRICDASRLSTRPGCVTKAPIQGHFLLVFNNLLKCAQNLHAPPRDASQTSHSSSVRPGSHLRYHRTLWPSPKPLCQPGAIW